MDKTSYSCPSDFEHQKLPFYIMSSELSNGTSKRIRFLVFVFLLHALFWCFFCSFLRAFFFSVCVCFFNPLIFFFCSFRATMGVANTRREGRQVRRRDESLLHLFHRGMDWGPFPRGFGWTGMNYQFILFGHDHLSAGLGHLAGLIGSADDLSSVPGRLVLLYPHFIFALYLGRVELLSYAVWCITPDANLVLFNCST